MCHHDMQTEYHIQHLSHNALSCLHTHVIISFFLKVALTADLDSTVAEAGGVLLTGNVWCHKDPPPGTDLLLESKAPTSEPQTTTRDGKTEGMCSHSDPIRTFQVFLRTFLCVSPHQTWMWTSGSADFRWPSISPAAWPFCGPGCCSIPCQRRLEPCQSLPPSLCTTRLAWRDQTTWYQDFRHTYLGTEMLTWVLTCNCGRLSLDARTSSALSTPCPWRPVDQTRWGPSLWGSGGHQNSNNDVSIDLLNQSFFLDLIAHTSRQY